jgi:hypothetical protein
MLVVNMVCFNTQLFWKHRINIQWLDHHLSIWFDLLVIWTWWMNINHLLSAIAYLIYASTLLNSDLFANVLTRDMTYVFLYYFQFYILFLPKLEQEITIIFRFVLVIFSYAILPSNINPASYVNLSWVDSLYRKRSTMHFTWEYLIGNYLYTLYIVHFGWSALEKPILWI